MIYLIAPSADFPHTVAFDTDNNTGEVRGLTVDGEALPLPEWATDWLKVSAFEIESNERRIAYWRGQVRHTAERVLRGEDGT